MTRRRVQVASLIVAALVIAAAAYFLLISPRGTQYVLPDCDQLPSAAKVEEAIGDHKEELDTIRQIDSTIEISITRPCPEDPDRAAILITVPNIGAADQVSEAMKSLLGLGVPATVDVQ